MRIAMLLTMMAVAPAGDEPSPAARSESEFRRLVEGLGADRYADREAAAAALDKIGRDALPALKTGREARDAEIRSRSAALIRKIEGGLLTRATRVRLDFDGRSIRDVAASLSSQAGFKVALVPENAPRWRLDRVTLREAASLDFWKAVDRVCEAADLQYNPNMHGYAAQREAVFALSDGVVRTVTPNSDHGPFRVSLLGLHYQRDVMYGAASPRDGGGRPATRPRERGRSTPLNPVASSQFTAQLVVAAEPRLSLAQNGPVQSIEAVDDLGNSLAPPKADENGRERYAGFFGVSAGAAIQLQVGLNRPALAGKVIKTLRGSIPLAVSSRRPDPVVVRLDAAVGKTFQSPDVELTIHDVRFAPNSRQSTIELSVKSLNDDAPFDPAELARQAGYRSQIDPNHLQIEIVDDQGALVPWFQPGVDLERGRATITLLNPLGSRPKELRYYRIIRATITCPFEFSAIPLP